MTWACACWPDYEAMLDAVDLDAVVVSLPHAALPAAALAAARRGRHVLLEKPMAATSAAAREVVRGLPRGERAPDGQFRPSLPRRVPAGARGGAVRERSAGRSWSST